MDSNQDTSLKPEHEFREGLIKLKDAIFNFVIRLKGVEIQEDSESDLKRAQALNKLEDDFHDFTAKFNNFLKFSGMLPDSVIKAFDQVTSALRILDERIENFVIPKKDEHKNFQKKFIGLRNFICNAVGELQSKKFTVDQLKAAAEFKTSLEKNSKKVTPETFEKDLEKQPAFYAEFFKKIVVATIPEQQNLIANLHATIENIKENYEKLNSSGNATSRFTYLCLKAMTAEEVVLSDLLIYGQFNQDIRSLMVDQRHFFANVFDQILKDKNILDIKNSIDINKASFRGIFGVWGECTIRGLTTSIFSSGENSVSMAAMYNKI